MKRSKKLDFSQLGKALTTLEMKFLEDEVLPIIRKQVDWEDIRQQILALHPDNIIFLKSWCRKVLHIIEPGSRLAMPDSEKASYHSQMLAFSSTIDLQNSKIRDLESQMFEKEGYIEKLENEVQKEVLAQSTLETQKLELMTEISALKLRQASLERENFDLKERYGQLLGSSQDMSILDGNGSMRRLNGRLSSDMVIRRPSSPMTATGPTDRVHKSDDLPRYERPISPLSHAHAPKPATPYKLASHASFGTVPRRSPHGPLTTISNEQPASLKCNSISATDLRDVEVEKIDGRNGTSRSKTLCDSSSQGKNKGIWKLFGKLKKNDVGSFDDDISIKGNSSFRRGGYRATAQPRLGWQNPNVNKLPDGPLSSWSNQSVIMWLKYIGLDCYTEEAKKWGKNGDEFVNATMSEVHKAFGVKNQMHKKKITLALEHLKNPEEGDFSSRLNYHGVIRWLDDIGLPQHKEAFLEARVDGLVLNNLTVEDLLTLKVTSTLHHASIKCGVQILRHHKFNADGLRRRGGPGPNYQLHKIMNNEADNGAYRGSAQMHGYWNPKEVAAWTNHRVMEWLRAIDLTEYAPNLRGSGVHGGLMVLEARFNSELLATLLSIPNDKSLLRRHLSLQFNELIGQDVVQEKRNAEQKSDFFPLNPAAKVKVPKKSQFSIRKRFSTEIQSDFICPKAEDESLKRLSEPKTNNQEMAMTPGNERECKVSDI